MRFDDWRAMPEGKRHLTDRLIALSEGPVRQGVDRAAARIAGRMVEVCRRVDRGTGAA